MIVFSYTRGGHNGPWIWFGIHENRHEYGGFWAAPPIDEQLHLSPAWIF